MCFGFFLYDMHMGITNGVQNQKNKGYMKYMTRAEQIRTYKIKRGS